MKYFGKKENLLREEINTVENQLRNVRMRLLRLASSTAKRGNLCLPS